MESTRSSDRLPSRTTKLRTAFSYPASALESGADAPLAGSFAASRGAGSAFGSQVEQSRPGSPFAVPDLRLVAPPIPLHVPARRSSRQRPRSAYGRFTRRSRTAVRAARRSSSGDDADPDPAEPETGSSEPLPRASSGEPDTWHLLPRELDCFTTVAERIGGVA
jgi:hypothetical protein